MYQNKGKEEDETRANQNVSQGAIGNDSIKGFCEVISKMAKQIGELKTDLNMIKRATISEKPLFENVRINGDH